MPLSAVLTGEIVNSTRLSPAREKSLLKRLTLLLNTFKFEFYRGDSFQVYMKDPGKALETALSCRVLAISSAPAKAKELSDIRIGIGIGTVNAPVRQPGLAKEEAFLLSGRVLDELEKSGERLGIASTLEIANAGFSVISDYANMICKKMTAKQAAVILELLKGHSQQEIAFRLKKSKSTINQHVTAGRWSELEKLIQQYRFLTAQLN